MTADLTSDSRWEPDMLGGSWLARTLRLRPDEEGEVVATLVADGARPRTERAVLYVHGYVDYFFQTHMADVLADHGYTFYALDLRRYGRSLRPHQTPNYVTRLSDYAEELDTAARIVRDELGHEELVVLGHSTGGLVTALWADARTRTGAESATSTSTTSASAVQIDALVLNSPWLDLNEPWFSRVVATRLIDVLGPLAPRTPVGGLGPHYGRALHKDTGGEWDYDLTLKPHEGFPARAGWLRAVRRGHAQVARGLDICCPVLVLTPDASGDPKRWHDAILTTDSVLDVQQTARLAPGLGCDVTLVTVPGAAHDLSLSPEPARSRFFEEVTTWLTSKGL
jgi:alpha-beta hydrolase superfamily lysophospholipase